MFGEEANTLTTPGIFHYLLRFRCADFYLCLSNLTLVGRKTIRFLETEVAI